jgi:dTDP-4-dehydrorhamnose 3,5-epimerase
MPIHVEQDAPTVDTQGHLLAKLPDGVKIRDLPPITDERGIIVELMDPRWGWHDKPIVFTYMFTVRPGFIKGWGMHKAHEDRYTIILGELEIVMYDDRPDSPTQGLVATYVLSEWRRQAINIPPGIWHANRNIGPKDVVVINFPTTPYDHENPDKYRLPLDTDKIPYKFSGGQSGW